MLNRHLLTMKGKQDIYVLIIIVVDLGQLLELKNMKSKYLIRKHIKCLW